MVYDLTASIAEKQLEISRSQVRWPSWNYVQFFLIVRTRETYLSP
jgi:hypothetical protein